MDAQNESQQNRKWAEKKNSMRGKSSQIKKAKEVYHKLDIWPQHKFAASYLKSF